MQLITTLLYAVAALTLLTGFSILLGATKQARAGAVWFFIATVGAAVWSAAIAAFLTLPEEHGTLAPLLVIGIISGITLTDVAMLGYTSWSSKVGKVLTLVFAALGVAVIALVAHTPELFYTNITFGTNFNTIHTVRTWYFYALIGYFFAISLVYSSFLAETIKHVKSKGAKNGFRLFRGGLAVGGILALVFDLLLLSSQPRFAWIGPMAVSISVIAFYYSIVRYRILPLKGNWINILSYIILAAAGLVVYLLVFYTVFTAIFRVPNPSGAMLVFNLIMVAIVLLLMPAISEVASMIRAYLPNRPLDMGYITRKLNSLDKNVDLKELASFLAQQLKFEYSGILLGGRLYGSHDIDISGEDLKSIAKLKLPKSGIWQELGERRASDDQVSRIAVLRNAKDEVYAQVLLGRTSNNRQLTQKELVEIEMVLKLVAIILDEDSSIRS